MVWRAYKKVNLTPSDTTPIKPRYSLTSDIMGFRLCPRQYGFFSVRGYIPARAVQLFYGTIIHNVLDRAHHHFQGREDPTTKDTIPSNEDIETYFRQVEASLRARGITAINKDLRRQALQVLKRFNTLEGPTLYPRVIDTEHRVQGDRGSYIVEGVVDVLLNLEMGSTDPSQVEIWDYKGSRRPDDKYGYLLDSYNYQMRVYAWLYNKRNACFPMRAVLYFVNELDRDDLTERPDKALYEVDIAPESIEEALNEFDETASSIDKCKEDERWDPPSADRLPSLRDTCAICDLRWSCSSFSTVRTPTIS